MKRLFLTGAPGWLANTLLESLVTSPPSGLEEIRCLVFPGTKLPLLPTNQVKVIAIPGRLEDMESLTVAVAGCDTALHAAGILHVRHTKDWYTINTQGTENLLKVSEQAGLQRLVLISSNAAAGRAQSRNHLMSENDPEQPLSHYGQSKLQAEKLVLNAPFESVVIRPCMFYGPPVPSRHIEIYQRIISGRMPLIGHGNYSRSLTHIENLIQGCRLALEHPKAPGNVYYIADESVYTTRQIIDAMASALETTPNYLRLPAQMAPLAYHGDRILAGFGLYWQSLHLVGEADWHVGVSIKKARDELGYTPTVGLVEGMSSAISWCHQHNLL